VTALQNVMNQFESPLSQLKNASALKITDIFKDIGPILETHNTLLTKLQAVMDGEERKKWPSLFAETLIEMTPFLKQVSPFIDRFEIIMKLVEALAKDKAAQKVLQDTKDKLMLDLQSHLIMPVQRVPRLELLLKDMINHTSKGRREYKRLNIALGHIRDVAKHCNERKREAEKQYKQNAVALRVKGLPTAVNIMQAGRTYVSEGRIMVQANQTRLFPVHYVLFSDLLLLTQNRDARGDQQSYKGHVLLTKDFKVEPVTENDIKVLKFHVPRVLRNQGFDLNHGFAIKTDKKTNLFFPLTQKSQTDLLEKLNTLRD